MPLKRKFTTGIIALSFLLIGCSSFGVLAAIAGIGYLVELISVEFSSFTVEPESIPPRRNEIPNQPSPPPIPPSPPQPVGSNPPFPKEKSPNSNIDPHLAYELQWIAVQSACLGIYNMGQTGAFSVADPVDYYQPGLIRSYLTSLSGRETKNTMFYGVCFNYAEWAYNDIAKYREYYADYGIVDWYLAVVLDNPNEIVLMELASLDDYDILQNGVPVKIIKTFPITNHGGGTYHAWIWVYTKDGTVYWIDPTWTDNAGYPFWGTIVNGKEVQADPSRDLMAINLDPYSSGYKAFNTGTVQRTMGNVAGAIENFNAAIQADPEQAIYYYNRASMYMAEGDFEKALADFNMAISLDAGLQKAYNDRGIVYTYLGEYEKALADYNKAIQIEPNSAEPYCNRGLTLELLKVEDAVQRAFADYNKALALMPYMAEAYTNRGNLYYKIGEFEKAVSDFSEALNYAPSAMFYYNRGRGYHALRDYELSIADYSKALSLNKTDFLTYLNRGNVYLDMGEYELAISDYTEAIKIDVTDYNAYFNRGNAYFAVGNYEAALIDYDKAASLFSQEKNKQKGYNKTQNLILRDLEKEITLPDIYYNRGNVYQQIQEYEKAIQDYTAALHLNSTLEIVFYNRALAYQNLFDYESALMDYTKALEINPSFAEGYYGRAGVYLNMNDYNAAIADYTNAINLDGTKFYYYYLRGLTYNDMSQYQLAIEDMTKALSLNPPISATSDIYYNRGNAYFDLRKYDIAVADYTEVISFNSDYINAYFNRGRANSLMGNYSLAVEDFSYILSLIPNDEDALVDRAIAYANMGDFILARKDLEVALKINPNNQEYMDLYNSLPLE